MSSGVWQRELEEGGVAWLGAPPEWDEVGNTLTEPGVSGIKAYVHHVLVSGTHTERWVLFDKEHFTSCAAFRGKKTEDEAYQGTWANVEPLINPLDVEGYIEMVFTYLAPPSAATDTGETGTFHTFVLQNQKTGVTPYVCGCLLRIEHSNGTWTDHWALFDNYEAPDGDWKMEATPQTSSDDWYFTTVGAFYEEMLSQAGWQHSPQLGWHVWVQNYTIEAGLP